MAGAPVPSGMVHVQNLMQAGSAIPMPRLRK
jgi:hypothetical protein